MRADKSPPAASRRAGQRPCRRARLEGHRQADFLAEGRVRQPDDGGLGDRSRRGEMRRIGIRQRHSTIGADQRNRRSSRYLSSWRAITMRWIWLVPS